MHPILVQSLDIWVMGVMENVLLLLIAAAENTLYSIFIQLPFFDIL
jgi:hypothetical protein